MEGEIKKLSILNKIYLTSCFIFSLVILFLPKFTYAAENCTYTGYFDSASKTKVYIGKLGGDKPDITLTQNMGLGENAFTGTDSAKNDMVFLKMKDETNGNWSGNLIITPEGGTANPACNLIVQPGNENSGGLVSPYINGGDQNGQDSCDGPMQKVGQWIVEGLAKSMTGYFGLINIELNKTADLQDNGLRDVWLNVRNLSLGLITLALIIIALANIMNIDIDKYGANKMIPKLLIATVMSYLSYFIAQIMLEVAGGLQALVLTTMAKNAAGMETLNVGAKVDASCDGGFIGLGILLAIIVLMIAFVCFLYLLIVLIVRKVVIYFLVAVAPLAFMMNVLPFTAKLYTDWWKRFSMWVFMGPAVMFVLYLGVTFMSVGGGGAAAKGGDFVIQVLMAGVSVAIAAMVPNMMGGEIYKGISNAWGKFGGYIPGVKAGKSFLAARKAGIEERSNATGRRWRAGLASRLNGDEATTRGRLKGMAGTFVTGANADQRKRIGAQAADDAEKELAYASQGDLDEAIMGDDETKAIAAARIKAGNGLLDFKDGDGKGAARIASLLEQDQKLLSAVIKGNRDLFAKLSNNGISVNPAFLKLATDTALKDWKYDTAKMTAGNPELRERAKSNISKQKWDSFMRENNAASREAMGTFLKEMGKEFHTELEGRGIDRGQIEAIVSEARKEAPKTQAGGGYDQPYGL